MWYNAMIPLVIIGTLTALPAYVSSYITNFLVGNPRVRLYDNNLLEQIGYVRDYEFAGKKVWKFNGLEVIPDK